MAREKKKEEWGRSVSEEEDSNRNSITFSSFSFLRFLFLDSPFH
jgi:hypothetical protein